MPTRNRCGKKIKAARNVLEMTQSDLCAALSLERGIEMTQNTLSNIERGARIVKDIELVAFSNILNVQPCWLLLGDDRQECIRWKTIPDVFEL